MWYPSLGLNQKPQPYQDWALPIELLGCLAEEPRFERGRAFLSLGPKPSVLPITLFLNKMVLPEGIEPPPFLAMERSTN